MAITSRSRILIVACAFAASALITAVFERVATACTAVYQIARDFVLSVPAKFEEPRLAVLARPVELVQACAYALGLAKRERPHVRSQWRMCPST